MGCGVAMAVFQTKDLIQKENAGKTSKSNLKTQDQIIKANISSGQIYKNKENLPEGRKDIEAKGNNLANNSGKENAPVTGKQKVPIVQKVKEKLQPEVRQNAKSKQNQVIPKESSKVEEKIVTQEIAAKTIPKAQIKAAQKPKEPVQVTTKISPPQIKRQVESSKVEIKVEENKKVEEKREAEKQVEKQVQKPIQKPVEKKEEKQSKRESMNIEAIINVENISSKVQQLAPPSMKKNDVSSKNLSKNSIQNQSRKSLKVKKEMVPVDSLFLQSVITKPEDADLPEHTSRKEVEPAKLESRDERTRNIPPSRKGKNEPIQIVDNLKQIDKNIELHKVNQNTSIQSSNISKDQVESSIIKNPSKPAQDRRASKQTAESRRHDEQKKAQQLRKKAEDQKRKLEQQKRIQQAKKKLQQQQKKSIQVETNKLKKIYNI